MFPTSRRDFLKTLGVSPAALPFVLNLPSLASESTPAVGKKQRLIVVFSPNGIVPKNFWPEVGGDEFRLTPILEPLKPFKDRTLVLKGIDGRVRGDGDSHMRGMGCLLTGIELFPGNIQGGGHTPAGWASGASIDQEIKNGLQSSSESRTRFGSLELGVLVPDRADVWTRMVYTGPNRPVAPISDPRQAFNKLYGKREDGKLLASVLDELQEDFRRVESLVSEEDRQLLAEHAELVRKMEVSLQADQGHTTEHPVPQIDPHIKLTNDAAPQLSRMQIELLVSSFLGDFDRVATLQYTNSVGGLRLKWTGVEESHHELSHRPDDDHDAVEKLTRINRWYCEQVALLAQRLSETPEPGGSGSLLDNTLIVWTNELGKGNSHTLNDLPFVMVGGGLGVRGGRALDFQDAPHNRLLLWLAKSFDLPIDTFGNPELCQAGPLTGLA